jgi:hypothetical protein
MDSGEEGGIEQAIGSLEKLVAAAPKVPLVDQVRIRAADLREAVENLHGAVRSEGAGFDREFADAVDELDRVVAEARSIPLTDDVRCDRRRIEAALEQLRARVPTSTGNDRWDWNEG